MFGTVHNGRYHMPLLPGETGTKSGGDYVPRGLMRVTNLVGAITDTRALSRWEQEQTLIGLVRDPSLYELLVIKVHQWTQAGVDFSSLRDHPDVREELIGTPFNSHSHERSIIGRAKHAAGANLKRELGNNRHAAWETRGTTGELIGTQEIRDQIVSVEALLAAAGLRVIPMLCERVVRNTVVNAVGKFDNVLEEVSTGRLLMADLKTKQRDFFSWLEIDAQLATYARSEWMLSGQTYEHGPLQYVDLAEGVVLHAPSDGAPPFLRRADLARGWGIAQLCRQVLDERSYAEGVERIGLSHWPETS